MNGGRGFGAGKRRKTDRRTRGGTARRTAKQKNAPGGGEGRAGCEPEPKPAEEGLRCRPWRSAPWGSQTSHGLRLTLWPQALFLNCPIARPPFLSSRPRGPPVAFRPAPRLRAASASLGSGCTLCHPVPSCKAFEGRRPAAPSRSFLHPCLWPLALSSGLQITASLLWVALPWLPRLLALDIAISGRPFSCISWSLSGIPSNSRHFLSPAGVRSERWTN